MDTQSLYNLPKEEIVKTLNQKMTATLEQYGLDNIRAAERRLAELGDAQSPEQGALELLLAAYALQQKVDAE